jgi:hypothetical protein
MIRLSTLMFYSGLDLYVKAQNLGFLRIPARDPYASRQARFFAVHGAPANDHVPSPSCRASGLVQG